MALLFAVAIPHAVPAQTCDPLRGVKFLFAQSVPLLSSATLKGLSASGRSFAGFGTVHLRDGDALPVQIKATYRGIAADRIRYAIRTLRGATRRVKGSLVTENCLESITKARFSLTLPNRVHSKLTDPALVGIMAIMKPHAVAVDATDIGGLTVNPIDKSLSIPSSDALLPKLVPGAVLVAGVTPATPRGVLRTVTGVVSHDDTMTVLSTAPASLADAYQHFHIDAGGAHAAGVLDATRTVVGGGFDLGPVSVQLPLPFPDIHIPDIYGRHLDLDGSLTLTGSLFYGIDLDEGLLGPSVEMHMKFQGRIDGSLNIASATPFEGSLTGVHKFKVVPPTIIPAPTEEAGIVPVGSVELGGNFTVTTPWSLTAQASLSGSLGLDCTLDATSEVPVVGGPDCSWDASVSSPSLCASVDLSGALDVKPIVAVKIDLLFGDNIGPALSREVFIDGHADTTANPWWTLDWGTSPAFSLDFAPLSGVLPDFLDLDATLVSHTFPPEPPWGYGANIDKATGPFDGGPVHGDTCGPPTTSTTSTTTLPPPCHAWNATYDLGSDAAGPVVADQNGDVFAAGSLRGDPALLKLNGDDGSEMWRWSGNSNSNGYNAIALLPNGNIVAAAPGSSAAATSLAMHDSTTGSRLWTSAFRLNCNGANNRLDSVTAIAAAANGDAFAMGSSLTCPGGSAGPYAYAVSRVDGLTGLQMWMTFLQAAASGAGAAVASAPDGNVVTAGIVSIGDRDAYYAAKLDASTGAIIWETIGASGSQLGHGTSISALTLDSAGNVIVAGQILNVLHPIRTPTDGSLMLVEKYDGASGAALWSWVFGYDGDCCDDGIDTSKSEQAQKVTVDANDDVFVGGSVGITAESCNYGGTALAIAKLHGGTGNLIWSIPSLPKIPNVCPVISGSTVTGLAADAASGDVLISSTLGNGQFAVARFDGSDATPRWTAGGAGHLGDVVLSNWGVVVAGTTPGLYDSNFSVLKLRASDGSATGACP